MLFQGTKLPAIAPPGLMLLIVFIALFTDSYEFKPAD